MIEEGLLTAEEVRCYSWGTQTSEIDYATLFDNRYKILWKAFERFDSNAQEFGDFVAKNEDWLVDYAIYMSMKMDNMNKQWQDWPKDEKNRQPVVLAKYRKTSYTTITFWMFCQYKFYSQWTKLKEYANARGIQLIGEIPFYVGLDSVDTWNHSELFLLDEEESRSVSRRRHRTSFLPRVRYGEVLYMIGRRWKKMIMDGGEDVFV